MSDNLFNLIPIVSAQELDSLGQPTFGNIDIGNQGGAVATVLLSSASTSPRVGDRFKVTIQINTNEQIITEYKLVIEFDSAKLSVIDQNTTVAGTQIKLLDQIFTIDSPAINNSVTSSGRITLLAKLNSGNPLSVNRNVAEIEFQAQQIGTANIKVVQGATGTELTRSNGTTLTYTPNEVSVQISTAQVTPNPVSNPVGGNNGGNTNNGGSNGGGTIIPDVIPDTGIEELVPYLPLSFGIFLMIIGISLATSKPKKKGLEP